MLRTHCCCICCCICCCSLLLLLFCCRIESLLSEFPLVQRFPEKELRITAQMYGGLIQHHILDEEPVRLMVVLRMVLEALRCGRDPSHPLFRSVHTCRPAHCQHSLTLHTAAAGLVNSCMLLL